MVLELRAILFVVRRDVIESIIVSNGGIEDQKCRLHNACMIATWHSQPPD
jgi:hypothetical protein